MGYNKAALMPVNWITQIMVIDCHKMFSVSSMDINFFSHEID